MRLYLPHRLAFWNRRQPVDLSCISSEDWERLERASRGDERELTARIMLLAYLAKANGHSTFDAVLPPDLTAEEANRLADRLVIGQGQRVGAPGRRQRMRLVARPAESTLTPDRIVRPSIFRLLEAVAMCILALGLLALPWALSATPAFALFALVFAGCAAMTRHIAPGFSIVYLLASAVYAEGMLRGALPVDVFLGTGALVAMALWTLLLQPHFRARQSIRRLAWFGIAGCGATAVAALVLQVQTNAVWGALLIGALVCIILRSRSLGELPGKLARINLGAAIPTVGMLTGALFVPGLAVNVGPLRVAEFVFALSSIATAASLVYRRRDQLAVWPSWTSRLRVPSRRELFDLAIRRGLPTLAVAFGLALAVALAPFTADRIVSNFDIYWLAATFSLASIMMLRKEPLVAVIFALTGATFAESVVRFEIPNWPAMQPAYGAAFGMWLLVASRPPVRRGLRLLLQGATAFAGLAWVGALGGIVLHHSFWVFILTVAAVVGAQRAFEAGVMSEPRLAIALAGFMPMCAELTLWTVGVEVPEYGTRYISLANMWLSIAPLGCILHGLVATATRKAQIQHGST